MSAKHLNLNIHYTIPKDQKEIILNVFRSMDGWVEESHTWFGPVSGLKFIVAEYESSGLHFTIRDIDPDYLRGWTMELCAKLSIALSREIYEPEMGAEFDLSHI